MGVPFSFMQSVICFGGRALKSKYSFLKVIEEPLKKRLTVISVKYCCEVYSAWFKLFLGLFSFVFQFKTFVEK